VVLVLASLLAFPGVLVRTVIVVCCLAFGLVHWSRYHAIRSPRHAMIYFAVQTLPLIGLVGVSGTSDIWGLLFFILGFQAVLALPNRTAIGWLALLYLIQSGAALWFGGPWRIINVLFNIAVFCLTYVFAHALRQAEITRRENEQLIEELRVAQRQLRDLAVADERNRLARDLHDSVKQQVFATTMQLGAARVLLERDPQAAKGHLHEAELLAQQAGAELSLLIHELRPVALGDKSLADALHAYSADWSRQTGIAAEMQAQGACSLPPATEHALLRVAQEALSNVARHSGATAVTIDLTYAADAVTLRIVDNGHGFDWGTARKGVGLDSMRERIEALDGRLQVESLAGGGTTICVQCGGSIG
jgi:signal transduction histidine kinase